MPTADWYRCKADECISLAKSALLNEEKVRLYALAEYYLRRCTGDRGKHAFNACWVAIFERRSSPFLAD